MLTHWILSDLGVRTAYCLEEAEQLSQDLEEEYSCPWKIEEILATNRSYVR